MLSASDAQLGFFEVYHGFTCGKARVGRSCHISFAVVPFLSFITTPAIDSKNNNHFTEIVLHTWRNGLLQ